MVAVQSLMKARLEMVISGLVAGLAEIAADNGELLAMQDRRYEGGASFVDPVAILTRLNANARRKAQLESELAAERQALLQASRRLDVLEGRISDCRREQEKIAETSLIDELIAGKLRFGSSLP
ncbi:hypothetical protein ATN84_13830 [Paramesorhizobium deserti]|uniref:Uncharacterized protein n=1 Tax=Paramesorhizobium deserti TaxID=1494590 RepID=A0A135HS38_9HYPH|nr:hypothetical protein [Paramesorhizobium deserti]KXF76004.1 hypothetical protein ATN84_13830 [Paramesorhizobium deserti]